MLCGLVGRWISHSLFVVMGVRVVIAAITMGFQSEGSPNPNTFHGNPHISVITSSMKYLVVARTKKDVFFYKRVQTRIPVLSSQSYSHLKTNLRFPVTQIIKRNTILYPLISLAAVPILL